MHYIFGISLIHQSTDASDALTFKNKQQFFAQKTQHQSCLDAKWMKLSVSMYKNIFIWISFSTIDDAYLQH